MTDSSRPINTKPDEAAANDARLLPRSQLRQVIANGIDHARLAQRYIAVLMVSLERRQKLTTFFGVPSAVVMTQAIQRLGGALRSSDRYLAITDEKICVVLPNLKSPAQAWLAAGKIQQLLETPICIDDETVSVRAVIGIATYPDHAELPEELVVHADIAAGVARSRDIAQHVFQNEDRREADIYVGLDAELREALGANRVTLQYQPQIDLATGECLAAEALLRWTSAQYGEISPTTLVRIAESHGLINLLTAWVMNTALREHAEWVRRGYNLGISINVSPLALREDDLPEIVAQTLGVWQTDAALVTFEITESHSLGDEDRSIEVLKRIKACGVRLAIDEFGTGYASLSYLRSFPLNELKLNQVFVQHLHQSGSDQQIVRSVIDIARNFNLRVVADGVEDNDTLKALKKMGCHLAQGNAVSPALPSEGFLSWLVGRGAKPTR